MSIPFYPQLEERDCGATCLRMALAGLGREVGMARLRELSGTNASGADLAGLADAAEALGFEAIAADLSYEDLLSPDLWPAILHWDGDHFVVLTEATDARAVVLDPAFGERRLDRVTFESHRVGAGRSRGGLVLLPPPSSPGEAAPAPPERRSVPAEPHGNRAAPTPAATPAPVPAPKLVTPTSPALHSSKRSYGRLYAAAALYAGLLAAGLYVVARALQLAVDLQYREGWLREVGALLAVAAAVSLGQHLLRRTGLAIAKREGDRDVAALERMLRASRQPPAPDAVLKLIEDIDAVKVLRAYHLATLALAAVAIVVAVLFALATDAYLGACLALVLAAVGTLHAYFGEVGKDTQASAVEAQVGQREAFHERVAAAPELRRLGLPDDTLAMRLEQRNRQADEAFAKVAAEVVARADLTRWAATIGTLAFLSLGLYRLGYEGLQVGPLLFLGLVYWLGVSRFWAFAKTFRDLRRTSAARARIDQLYRAAAGSREPRRAPWPEAFALTWDSPRGQRQRITFPASASLGLVGGDGLTRGALVRACLGVDNARRAELRIAGDDTRAVRLQDFGRVALIGGGATLVAGTVASNVTLSAGTDLARLRRAAERAGLEEDALEAGFSTAIPLGGGGVGTRLRTYILLARAFYHEADVIVLDGGTDGLTAYDEAYVVDTLAGLPDTRLFVCNARRPLATVGLDYLAQLEEGEVEAFGSHEELLAAGGAYAIQYAAQNVLGA